VCAFVYSFVDDMIDGDGSPNWSEALRGSYRNYGGGNYGRRNGYI
jgi:hypothetical protein